MAAELGTANEMRRRGMPRARGRTPCQPEIALSGGEKNPILRQRPPRLRSCGRDRDFDPSVNFGAGSGLGFSGGVILLPELPLQPGGTTIKAAMSIHAQRNVRLKTVTRSLSIQLPPATRTLELADVLGLATLNCRKRVQDLPRHFF